MADPKNISTEHQPKGSAINQSAALDRTTDAAGNRTVDEDGNSEADYRRKFGDKPDSATVTHAPPSPDADPNA